MTDQLLIQGGRKLSGKISVKGAKNAALKLFAAALLTDKKISITNVPEVEDVRRMTELLSEIGCEIGHTGHGKYTVRAHKLKTSLINPEISKRLRASIVLTGPLLARLGQVQFPHPGGCVIGKRPIDVFLDGYLALGAKINVSGGLYNIEARHLEGAEYFFNVMSVTGTETLMLASVFASGTTTLKNCACEPEISSLADFLNACGAKISGAGTNTITIRGVKSLSGGSVRVIPDRIETGTFAILAVATKSNITITNCAPDHLESLWHSFSQMGVPYELSKNSVKIFPVKKLSSTSIKTHEYPGFPTDLQAPMCVLLTQAEGIGLMHETIYEGRLSWTEDLKRMGANITMFDPHRIQIQGKTSLAGKELKSPDLRAGMAFIIAGLCASGKTTLDNIYQIDRGYESIEKRLREIGADIKRI